ncbi:TetR/AcrR family transcriptional regulator [Hoeflea ulvae]|uniref:TetR/AcrR family transcriptional regulator n=1 Tax=Hoeflea ulvae TaxID=2983764 RepID=A0ABT3YJ61_9HYPH|nr:TetR/AcrR family transcriptional regulator [Hoeflea ulvae]MCY0095932.1 TetR/AcrR family transcriptional regulator [Hoeflea ulvae]
MNNKIKMSNEDRSTTTRRALIGAARELFLQMGYAEASTPELVKAAGVTRGALYHHFEDKKAVFRAVVENELSEVAEAIRNSAKAPETAMAGLKSGTRAYLDAMQIPGRAHLLLVEGPAALGIETMKQINDISTGQTLREGLETAMASGEIRTVPLSALATLLDAAFDRAALDIAGGGSPEDIDTALTALLDGLATTS